MDHMKKPDDEGLTHIQRLSPDQFDVVLGAHPSKQKVPQPAKSGSFGRTLVVLTALGIGAYALIPQFHTSKPAVVATNAQPATDVPSETVAVVAPVSEPTPVAKPVAPTVEPIVVVSEPELDSEPEPAATPRPAKPAQGMVSAAYMADFKHDLAHSATPQRRVKTEIATAEIHEWDGRNRYRAQWRIFNNHIEGDSVCFNFPAASIEHRECRKAAQVFFKEECREWSKRSESDREEQSKLTQTRYCEAAGSFNPAG
ncbi:hypothetical protein [Pseudomonas sp. NA-150]|uniref:hypothetical protein n=1 Tax=Pseudomonas sp. NA-150 TaxID=3367525 RepID=UPI0037CC2143